MEPEAATIRFRLDPRSGVPAYRQIVDQVRHAISLGLLSPGDQLPPVREVVTQITINPNTVHRAYRELESQGVVRGEQGRGTFVLDVASPPVTPEDRERLRSELFAWLSRARVLGLDEPGIEALIAESMRQTQSLEQEVGR